MADQVIPGDGVIAGHGRVDGRVVYAFAQDFTVFGGSLSETNAAKIVKVMDLAMKMGAPIVGLNDSAARASRKACCRSAATPTSFSATRWRPAWSRRFPPSWARVRAAPSTRRRSPTSPSWCADSSYMFVTGPDVIKTVTHEDVYEGRARRGDDP